MLRVPTRPTATRVAPSHRRLSARSWQLAAELTFPTAGRYIVNTEFRRQGEMDDIHQRQVLTVRGTPSAPEVLSAGPRSVVVDGVRVELDGDAETGGTSDLHFGLTDAATGRPIDDLQPYLAAAGHVIVMRADGTTFAHEHAEVTDEHGRPKFALPGQTFGPSWTYTQSSPQLASTRHGPNSVSPMDR